MLQSCNSDQFISEKDSGKKCSEKRLERTRGLKIKPERVFYFEGVKCYLDSNYWFLGLFQFEGF